MSGILISIGAHTGNAIIAAVSLAFATAFVLCVEGPFWAMMMRIGGKNSGKAGGIMNMGSNLGGLISPMLTPLMATLYRMGECASYCCFFILDRSRIMAGYRAPKICLACSIHFSKTKIQRKTICNFQYESIIIYPSIMPNKQYYL